MPYSPLLLSSPPPCWRRPVRQGGGVATLLAAAGCVAGRGRRPCRWAPPWVGAPAGGAALASAMPAGAVPRRAATPTGGVCSQEQWSQAPLPCGASAHGHYCRRRLAPWCLGSRVQHPQASPLCPHAECLMPYSPAAIAVATLLAAACAARRGRCPRLQAARPLAALLLRVGAPAGGSAGGTEPAGGAALAGAAASAGGSARGATPVGGAVPPGGRPCGGVSPAGATAAGAAALRRLTPREKRPQAPLPAGCQPH
uniref:Uncharacterized protein n=1 Tax=Musa acuminata subsp. malaccensis TaxID=214687 RepID=A0A804L6F6_MUSAM|nr:PREDICTED: cuticlin-2-like [Musa acuminata subsp. malaccensis]